MTALDRMVAIARMVLGASSFSLFRAGLRNEPKGQYLRAPASPTRSTRCADFPAAAKGCPACTLSAGVSGYALTGEQIARRLWDDGGIPHPQDLLRGALACSQSRQRGIGDGCCSSGFAGVRIALRRRT